MKFFAILTLTGLAMALPNNLGQADAEAQQLGNILAALESANGGGAGVSAAADAGKGAGKGAGNDAAKAGGANNAAKGAGNATAAAACDAATAMKVAQLAGGISSNIGIQVEELAGVQTLQSLVSGNNTKRAAAAANGLSNFEIQRQAVLQIQQNGVDLRTGNQKIAGEIKSPSVDGLNTVQTAQLTEISQVKSLTGTSADAKTLQTLVQEVQDGTKQNMANLQAALSQCP